MGLPLPGSLTRFVHEPHAIDGWFRPIAASVYRVLTAQELLVARALDALLPRPADDQLVAQATALIKTFERPRVLRRLLSSLQRLYPSLSIVVIDDSREPVRLEGVTTVVMPYDSGISAGRNEGLKHVTTKYVLVLDDDLVFYRNTRLAEALALLEQHPEIDIMGGQLVDVPFLTTRPLGAIAGSIYATEAVPTVPIGSTLHGLTVCEKVANFFLARTDRLALVPWDPELKRMEHADFFTRALGTLTTVYNPRFKCFHARTPFEAAYMAKRLDVAAPRRLLAERYGDRR